ncbi:hypothetical protein [Sphingobacterium bambusae]|uniref:Uncharacterized protein n=1 Tax=Sphingobacterium bambusae TaxID=662858 RepID=A0ABW6BIG7_9SPHI|nr:hypothetical protein [Sphingobacterium bambusae]WPL47469.1 hypothetical protein SCB77_16065 [Sphingobacterium bambusae]
MASPYFKARRPFDFRPHPYEIGNILGAKKGFEDNHFLAKVYDLDTADYRPLYDFHLQHFQNTAKGTEAVYFRHIWQLAEGRIAYFKSRNPFSSDRENHEYRIAKLHDFMEFLRSIDQWNVRPLEEIIVEQNTALEKQQNEIQRLREKIAELEQYNVSQKIMVQDNHLSTFVDLLQQLADLELPNGRKLLRSDHQSPFYKMLCRYFSYDGKDIPINTARNYFIRKDAKDAKKGVVIPEEKKLFQIVMRHTDS